MNKILVVEDDPDQLQACVHSLQLTENNYSIDTATSKKDAIKKVGKTVYDIVITDLRLTPLNHYEGLEVIRAIKKKDPSVVSHKRLVLFFLFLRERGNVQPG